MKNIILITALLLSTPSFAQVPSPKITITNTTPQAQIQILPNSAVNFTSDGNIEFQCQKNGQNCVSQNIGGETGTPPTNLFLTPSTTSLPAGSNFSLTWGGTGSQVCLGTFPTNLNGWSNVPLTPSRASPGLSLSLAQGVYNFEIRCFSNTASATVSSPTVTVGPGTNGDYCQEYYASGLPTGSQFNAHGFEKVEVPFQTIWQTEPGFSAGVTSGVPGLYLETSQGRYLSIPFTLLNDSGPGTQVNLSWVESQLPGVTTGAITLTISPCAGDFRSPVVGSPDAYLSFQCRKDAGIAGNISATSNSSLGGCPAPKNKRLFINIATYDMFVPTPPQTTTCSGNSTCGVAMRTL